MLANKRPQYFPHLEDPAIVRMGLSPLAASKWLEPDEDLACFRDHKLALYANCPNEVYNAEEGSIAAQRELQALLLDHLLQDHSALFQRDADRLCCQALDLRWSLADKDVPPAEILKNCALWIQDDICILQERKSQYCLTAASLCSPSQWYLRDKFGQPLNHIHEAVPGLDAQIGNRVTRFFSHLRPENPVQRFNWSVQPGDNLYYIDKEKKALAPGTTLFWRVERQSLRRLPVSRAVVFTIRIYLHPLRCLAEVPGALPALFAAIDDCPPEQALYKGFDRLMPALDAYRYSQH